MTSPDNTPHTRHVRFFKQASSAPVYFTFCLLLDFIEYLSDTVSTYLFNYETRFGKVKSYITTKIHVNFFKAALLAKSKI